MTAEGGGMWHLSDRRRKAGNQGFPYDHGSLPLSTAENTAGERDSKR